MRHIRWDIKNSSPKFAHSTQWQKNVEQIDKEISQDIVCELKYDCLCTCRERKLCIKQRKKTTISNTT